MRAAVVLVLGTVFAGCVHPRVVEDGELQEDGLARVADETARVRRLGFVRDVPSRAVGRAEQKAFIKEYIAARDELLTVDTRLYRRLGILRADDTMQQVMRRQFGPAIGGFYSWEQGGQLYVSTDYNLATKLQLEVIAWLTGIDWAYELVLSHELVHALQDQHHDLDALAGDDLVLFEEDLVLARTDVIESDAGLAGFAHFHGLDIHRGRLQRRLNAALVAVNYAPIVALPWLVMPTVPSFFAKRSLGHYLRGIGYVNDKLDEGGFPALDRAYERGLLESTEQLLWPEKRPGEPGYDAPVRLAQLDEEPAWAPGFSRLRSNVFGELQWRLWLESRSWLPGQPAAVAAGWGGDRYELYARGEEELLVWRSTWDTEPDAEEAEAALRSFLADKTRAGALGVVERRGRRVVLVEGTVPVPRGAVAAAFASFDDDAAPRAREVVIEQEPAAGSPDLVLPSTGGFVPPPRPAGPTLRDRFLLSHRKMQLTLGVGVRADGGQGALARTRRTYPLFEFRWGLRRNLEWADPFALSLGADTPVGRTILTVGMDTPPLVGDGWFLSAGRVRWTHGLHVTEQLALAGQVEGVTYLDTLFPEDTFGQVRFAAGVFTQPLRDVTIAVGVGRASFVDVAGPLGLAPPRAPAWGELQLGSVLLRGGRFRQPLVEVRLFDLLHGFGTATVTVDEAWRVTAVDGAVGLTSYF